MKQSTKLSFLNPIKFILALSIILWHISFGFSTYIDGDGSNNLLWGLRELTKFGGNQAFLLIAGMLFYIAYYEKLQEGTLAPKDFLIKRAKRIYPWVIVSVLIAYISALIAHYNFDDNESINLLYLLIDCLFFGTRFFGGAYGYYNGPIWFLSVLVFCYLISVLIIILTKKKKSIWWFLIPLLLFFMAGVGSSVITPNLYIGSIANESFNFFLGMFFMLFLTKFLDFPNYVKIIIRLVGITLFATFIFAFYHSLGDNPLGNGEIVGSIFCWIPLFTALYGFRFNKILDNRCFKCLGQMSFFLFIWHVPLKKLMSALCNTFKYEIQFEGYRMYFIFMVIILLISFACYLIDTLIKKDTKRWKLQGIIVLVVAITACGLRIYDAVRDSKYKNLLDITKANTSYSTVITKSNKKSITYENTGSGDFWSSYIWYELEVSQNTQYYSSYKYSDRFEFYVFAEDNETQIIGNDLGGNGKRTWNSGSNTKVYIRLYCDINESNTISKLMVTTCSDYPDFNVYSK